MPTECHQPYSISGVVRGEQERKLRKATAHTETVSIGQATPQANPIESLVCLELRIQYICNTTLTFRRILQKFHQRTNSLCKSFMFIVTKKHNRANGI